MGAALLAIASLCCASMIAAYEISTHAGMTNATYGKSILSASSTYDRLGLTTLAQRNLKNTYLDLADALPNPILVRPRSGLPFESDIWPASIVMPDAQLFGVRGWLMRGAVREDDTSSAISFGRSGSPRDDPDGNINRFCNHFFDPVNVRALSTFCFNSTLDMSPNWAIGTTDAFANPVQRQSLYRNHYTIFGAREAMWRALTLKDVFGGNIALGTNAVEREAERLAYWATTFRSVGDVVHLIQDMAQPQHTRNEDHGTGRNAIYEAYADARAGGPRAQPARTFVVDASTLSAVEGTLRPLDYELRDQNGALVPYPIPRFNNYTDYWTTARGAAGVPRPQSITAGLGLADYSSRGFLTLGTSLNGATFSEFSSPPRLSSDPTYAETPSVDLCDSASGANIKAKYLLRDVVDLTVPTTTQNIKLQSRSAWNNSIGTTFYTMNHCVMDDHLRLLIPRAVAYSAGLIDYFFRGQLEIRLPNEGVYAILDHSVPGDNCKDTCGFKKIKLKLANATPDITPSGGGAVAVQTMTGGTLVAVAKYHKNTCYTTDLEGEYDSGTLINGSTETVL